jgi:hypothetical protein
LEHDRYEPEAGIIAMGPTHMGSLGRWHCDHHYYHADSNYHDTHHHNYHHWHDDHHHRVDHDHDHHHHHHHHWHDDHDHPELASESIAHVALLFLSRPSLGKS